MITYNRETTRRIIEENSSPEPNTGCWIWMGAIDNYGYGRLQVADRHIQTHRVSYLAYKSNPGKLCVLHRCDTPICVNPEHLFLGTQRDNLADCVSKGRNVKGSRQGRSKLKEQDIKLIIELLQSGKDHPSIAAKFNVSRVAITQIARGKNWKHLLPPGFVSEYRSKSHLPVGSQAKHAKLSESDVLEMLRAVKFGESQISVARRFGISGTVAHLIVQGKRWKHVPRKN